MHHRIEGVGSKIALFSSSSIDRGRSSRRNVCRRNEEVPPKKMV